MKPPKYSDDNPKFKNADTCDMRPCSNYSSKRNAPKQYFFLLFLNKKEQWYKNVKIVPQPSAVSNTTIMNNRWVT